MPCKVTQHLFQNHNKISQLFFGQVNNYAEDMPCYFMNSLTVYCFIYSDTEELGDFEEIDLASTTPTGPSKLVNDDGSLQRQRTAWNTLVGHDRISSDDLRNR